MEMSLSRLLNMTYYFLVRNASKDDREKIDREIHQASNGPQVQMRNALPQPSQTRRKKIPSWWKGDATAVSSSVDAARQLGFQVMGAN